MSILQFLAKAHFDFGARRELKGELQRLNCQRTLFVTDKGVIQAGVFAKATDSLASVDAACIFDQTPNNPTEAAAVEGYQQFQRLQCDSIVAIGGGASLDLAKAIAVLCGDPAPLWEYCNRNANMRPVRNTPPLFVLPTTSGSGSELGRSAVIIFDNGIKAGVACPQVVTAAICDPELTLGLPPRMTAATGMDALSHCIETFCSPTINPPADAIALDGLQRLYAHIERACTHGEDADARWHMMMGALEGGICFQKGMGAVHSLSHALGAYGHHHGTLNALFLPPVLRYNADVLEKAGKMDRMRHAMKLEQGADLPAAIAELNTRIGLPRGLRELGVGTGDFDAIASSAMLDNAHKTNPRPVSHADYVALLHETF
jgi:alcohol dehydrogenase class IV